MSEASVSPRGPRTPAQQRQLIVLASVAAIIAVGAAVYFLFMSGGSSPSNQAVPTHHVAPSATAAPASGANAAAVVPAAYTAPNGRNPFSPLVTPTPTPTPSGSATPPASSSATPSTTPTPTFVFPTTTATGRTSPTPTVTVTATPSPTGLPTAGQSITLTLVSVDSTKGTADVTVTQGATTTPFNGVKPGQVFGTYFKLVSILSSDPANPPVTYGAAFEYGDQFVQLATGQGSQFG